MSETLRGATADQTDVGSYFVATYPPFSVWSREAVERDARPALATPPQAPLAQGSDTGQTPNGALGSDPCQTPRAETPLGLYLHIPFCRKRCHFCYFRVYTDKNAQEVARYLDVLAREWELYARQPAIAGRPLAFVYFGGGTPSFLSTPQLESLVKRLTATASWRDAEEITFECEPGTLTESKLAAIRRMGVTRLSLGVENFDDRILEINGRAHRSPEIGQAYRYARSLGFPQINIDLIAGMLGETEENWRACVQKTLDLAPDSVTIYQMELPFNTTISKDLLKGTKLFAEPVVSWSTKRRWVEEAFAALERAGYHVRSAYTAVRDPERTKFVYTDQLWKGADMAGLGVASFGHVNGVHMQNCDTWETYSEAVERGELPLNRAYRPTDDERMIRELVLQLKLGSVRPAYFRSKYGVDLLRRFRDPLASLAAEGCIHEASERIVSLTRHGLLRVDVLLPRFFLPQHVGIRYT
jgi:oxygen-independent coproporphyrinogen III oxidase